MLQARHRTVSPFPFLRTCIAAGEPASSNVSSQSLNHLSSSVLAARSKLFNTVLPFGPKGMAKSQNGQACNLALSPEEHALALTAQRRQLKLCPNFFPSQSTHKNSVATLHKHRTAEKGILDWHLSLKKVPKDSHEENGQLANCTIWPLFSGW